MSRRAEVTWSIMHPVKPEADNLREVVALAHHSGRPEYYWHRAVMVPRASVAAIPGRLDDNGECDLPGDACQQLVRLRSRKSGAEYPAICGTGAMPLSKTASA